MSKQVLGSENVDYPVCFCMPRPQERAPGPPDDTYRRAPWALSSFPFKGKR